MVVKCRVAWEGCKVDIASKHMQDSKSPGNMLQVLSSNREGQFFDQHCKYYSPSGI